MGRWLQDYSGSLAAIATIVLVIVTGIYVRLTRTLSQETKRELDEMTKMRLDARMPVVAISGEIVRDELATSVRVVIQFKNVGHVIADVIVDYPPDWYSSHSLYSVFENGTIYLTVNPETIEQIEFEAAVDPTVPIASEPPLRHLQFFSIDIHVAPQAGEADDFFSWSATYDPSDDSFDRSTRPALHEYRSYFEVEHRKTAKRRRLHKILLKKV